MKCQIRHGERQPHVHPLLKRVPQRAARLLASRAASFLKTAGFTRLTGDDQPLLFRRLLQDRIHRNDRTADKNRLPFEAR